MKKIFLIFFPKIFFVRLDPGGTHEMALLPRRCTCHLDPCPLYPSPLRALPRTAVNEGVRLYPVLPVPPPLGGLVARQIGLAVASQAQTAARTWTAVPTQTVALK